MTITIFPPMALHELGGRDNNEDAIYPPLGKATDADRLFLVCDGMGGLAKGEEASRLVTEAVARFFDQQPGPATAVSVALALQQAEAAIQTYLTAYPDSKGMGTTLTLLHLHEGGATVAHVGDSRVYHCRAGKILFQTDDHKLVNQWVQAGILTPEQAEEHPQRNVITRAVQGKTQTPAQADVHYLTDLQPGDYFLLCTDGLLEQLTDDRLEAILAQNDSDAHEIAAMLTLCKGRTADNFSTYLIQLKSVEGEAVNLSPVPATTTSPAPATEPLTVLPAEPIPAAYSPPPASAPAKPPLVGQSTKTATASRPPSASPEPWWQKPINWLVGAVVVGIVVWQLSTRTGHHKPTQLKPPRPQNNPVPQPFRPSKPLNQ